MSDAARRQAAEVVMSMTPALDPDVARHAAGYLTAEAFESEDLGRCWTIGVAMLEGDLFGDVPTIERIAAAAGVDWLWWRALAARCPTVTTVEASAIVGRAAEERRVREALVAGVYMLDADAPPARVARVVADRLVELAA